MKKTVFLAAFILALPLALFAAKRVVVLELFCRTACSACPAAAIGADAVAENHPGEVLVVQYHVADPFENSESRIVRADFYFRDTLYLPTAIFDGVVEYRGPGAASRYDSTFLARADSVAPLEITLVDAGQAYLNHGTLTATIENTSEEEITGKVHFTVTESNIPYSWVYGKDEVNYALRVMLPNAYGAEITLAAGADTIISREYVINPAWPYFTDDWQNIEFGCFVQDTTPPVLLKKTLQVDNLREILQAAVIPMEEPVSVSEEERKTSLLFSLDASTLINGNGSIELFLNAPSNVNLALFDASGRLVKTLHAGILSSGVHRINIKTEKLPRGAYFLKPTAGAFNQTDKLLILN